MRQLGQLGKLNLRSRQANTPGPSVTEHSEWPIGTVASMRQLGQLGKCTFRSRYAHTRET